MRAVVLFFIPLLISIGNCSVAFEGYEVSTTSVSCTEYGTTTDMYQSTTTLQSPIAPSSTTVIGTVPSTFDSALLSSTTSCATATVSTTTTLTVTTYITVTAGETTMAQTPASTTITTNMNTTVPSVTFSPSIEHTSQPSSGGCGYESSHATYTTENLAPAQSSLYTSTSNAITNISITGTESSGSMSTQTSRVSTFSPSQTIVSAGTTSPVATAPVSQFSSAANVASRILVSFPIALCFAVINMIYWI